MRGWVCRLQLLLALASAVILRSESHGTHDHILLSQIRDSPSLEGQVHVFLSPRNRVAQLYPQALSSLFVASYDSQGYGGGIRYCLHTGSHPRFFNIDECTPFTNAWSPPPRVPFCSSIMRRVGNRVFIPKQSFAFLSVYNFQCPYPWKACFEISWFPGINLSVATCLPIRFLETAYMSQYVHIYITYIHTYVHTHFLRWF
jgi:hypothetical protein